MSDKNLIEFALTMVVCAGNVRGAAKPRGEAGRSGDGCKPGFTTRDAMHEVTPISDDLWRELHVRLFLLHRVLYLMSGL